MRQKANVTIVAGCKYVHKRWPKLIFSMLRVDYDDDGNYLVDCYLLDHTGWQQSESPHSFEIRRADVSAWSHYGQS